MKARRASGWEEEEEWETTVPEAPIPQSERRAIFIEGKERALSRVLEVGYIAKGVCSGTPSVRTARKAWAGHSAGEERWRGSVPKHNLQPPRRLGGASVGGFHLKATQEACRMEQDKNAEKALVVAHFGTRSTGREILPLS